MSRLSSLSPSMMGAISVMIAVTFMSVSDMTIKLLSGGYPLHELVLIRTVVGLAVLMAVILPITRQGLAIFYTTRLRLHLFRGFCVVIANMTFFLGLVAMDIAEAVAIFFISPLLITLFSVVFLGERVGIWRWGAVAIGLLGVIIMVRPGAETFQVAALYPLGAAVAYASIHATSRKLGTTDSAGTMSLYTSLVFIVVCVVIGLLIGDGKYAEQSDISLTFLFRPWVWPLSGDIPMLLVLGTMISFAGWFMSHAYKVAELAVVAPFEYLAMPMSIFWGYVMFDEWPDAVAWAGIALVFSAGIVVIWREASVVRKVSGRAV